MPFLQLKGYRSLPDEIPEKQGLKPDISDEPEPDDELPDEIPEKQGLKQNFINQNRNYGVSPGRNSRKTRIETVSVRVVCRIGYRLPDEIPEKQGLKLLMSFFIAV